MRDERHTVISLHEAFIFHNMTVSYKYDLYTKFQKDRMNFTRKNK